MENSRFFIFQLIILFLFFGYVVLAWTEPIAAPPGGNVDPPINTSAVSQTKIGDVGAARFFDSGNSAWFVDPFGAAGVSATFAEKVGIGTNNPGAKLDVQGQIYVNNVIANNQRNLMSFNVNGLNIGHFYDTGTANNIVALGGSGTIAAVPAAPIMSWDLGGANMGNVGIGIIANTATLDVERNINDSGNIFSIGTMGGSKFNFARIAATGALSVQGTQIGFNNIVFVPTSGNVGVGDSTPDAGLKLDVEGRVGATEYCDQNGANCMAAGSIGGGTVTSVGLALPAQFAVTNSPIVGAGTLTGSWVNQAANTVFAAPNGAAGIPSFRNLAITDLPAGAVLPAGANGDTLRYNGGWVANNNLYNNGANVGIGTNNPGAKLDVQGQIYVNNVIANNQRNLMSFNVNGLNIGHFYDTGTANNIVALGGSGTIAAVPAAPIMSWDLGGANMGNVGIGTNAPAYLLDVAGGDINTTGIYRRNGVAGASGVCPVGQTFSGLASSGGIITSVGACVAVGGGGAPIGASYVTTVAEPGLTGERVATAGAGITLTPAANSLTIAVDTTTVQPKIIGSCAGQVVVGIDAMNNFICEPDDGGVGGGDITGVGSMLSGNVFADPSADDQWLGLGAAAGRIEFDNQGTDEINVLSARLGVGTNAPAYLLDVGGDGRIMGNLRLNSLTMFGDILPNATNAYNLGADTFRWNNAYVNKLYVNTIDPQYEINGKNYATYVSDFAGGVRTETAGLIQLPTTPSSLLSYGGQSNNQLPTLAIDFGNLAEGSDLWLFWQTSNKNIGDLVIILTPSFDGKVWYEKQGNKILIFGEKPGEVSYRLTMPRKDANEWGNIVK